MAKNNGFPWGTVILVVAGGGILYFWYVGTKSGQTNPVSAIGAGISNMVQGFVLPVEVTLGGLGIGAGGYGAYRIGSSLFGSGASATTTAATTAASDVGSGAAGDTYNFFGDIGNWFDSLNLSGAASDLGTALNEVPK
jgi:hypothetical protein